MGKTTVDPMTVTFSLRSLREITTINRVLDEALQWHAAAWAAGEGRSAVREEDIRAALTAALADVRQAFDIGVAGRG
jgi:hypothetical protein